MAKKSYRQYTRKRRRPDIDVALASSMKLKGRFWIERRGRTFLAAGRVELLENIGRYNSITKAANRMKISYTNAWKLIKQMNIVAGRKLVTTHRGGAGGGGAQLTEHGIKCIRLFYETCERANSKLDNF